MTDRCPTCGQTIEVVTADEGTSFYVGIDARDASTWPTAQAWLDWLRDPQAASDETRNGIHATPEQGSQPAHTNAPSGEDHQP